MITSTSKKLIDFTSLGIDTKKFSIAAQYYLKNNHYPDFNDVDWWDTNLVYLRNGYEIEGKDGIKIKITGEHFGYLNFCKIKLTEDADKNKAKKVLYKKAITKRSTFPAFWDGDYIFYWCKYIARWGASDYPEVKKNGGLTLEEFANLRLPEEIKIKPYTFEVDNVTYTLYGSGKNVVVGKKRRGGYSYKMGYAGAHRYHFMQGKSTTLLAAYDNKYLIEDALMTKTVECLDFIDSETAYYKQRIKNELDWKKSGRKETINGVEVEKGKLSQILTAVFRANTGALRGKDADEIYIEEAGKAPNLLETINATLDTLGDGVYSSGQMIIFGTGGGDNSNWEGFQEIFYNPSKYNCLEFENTWDENALGTYCGLFIPDYWTNVGWITENGESLVELAKQYEKEYQYEMYISKGDVKGLIARRMEHPHCPAEAFAVSNNNIFDVPSIRDWRVKLERENLHNNMSNIGYFSIGENGKLKYNLSNEKQPYWDYPVKGTGDKTGSIVIWQPPIKTNGEIPANAHIIDVDTYRFDDSTGPSVGACYVYLRSVMGIPQSKGDRLVASYIGRPRTKDEFCKQVFYLADYYNAKIGYENDDQTLLDYAKTNKLNLSKYFESEFELAYDEKLKTANGNVSRRYGMHIGSGKLNERKLTGDEYIKEWLETVRHTTETGETILNLHTIYDIGLLKELESYDPVKGNYDRVAAFRITMYHIRELSYKRISVHTQRKSFALDNHRCFQ